MAGLVPATPIMRHSRAKVIGVAGTSPAMTAVNSLHLNMLRARQPLSRPPAALSP
jgi:hypothetical protein